MTLNINQFNQSTVAGEPDLQFPGSVVTARVSTNQVTALVAGQAVKVEDTTGPLPNVLATAALTDPVWGIVLRNLKDASFPALAALEIGRDNTVVYLTASAAISRGVPVQIDPSTFQIATWDGVSTPIGEAYGKATAQGDLIRVWLRLTPFIGNVDPAIQTVDVTATLAQINAGLTLVAGQAGSKLRVLNYVARVTGAFATGTSVELESTNGTPVAVSTIAEAALTNGAVLLPSSANTTLGAGFGAQLGTGDGLKVVNNGSAQTGGTSIEFTVTYERV